MKRSPRAGEPALIHVTKETGDAQAFAISTQNFSPAVIKLMRQMESRPLAGFRLRVEPSTRASFLVLREDGTELSINVIHRNWAFDKTDRRAYPNAGSLTLITSIVCPTMTPDEAAQLADLEQCAAIMLLEEREEGL